MTTLFIGLCGSLGVLARYGIGLLAERLGWTNLPWATFTINLLGAFGIGVLYAWGVEGNLLPRQLSLALTVGFLGGFTTFSSYCLEGVRLIERGDVPSALAYLALSPVLGLLLAAGGLFLGRKFV